MEAGKSKICRVETQESQRCSSSPKAVAGEFPLSREVGILF